MIGVDTRNLSEISVTRLARSIDGKDIEAQVGRALERRNGLGDAANLSLTFDRDPGDIRLDAGFTGAMQPASVRFDNRNGRFDVTLEIANDNGLGATKLRFTGTAVETVEAAVLARNVERNEVLKSSDVVIERRPKSEVGVDAATRERALGMQARRQLRAGQPVRIADLVKPDLVQRDQAVTLIYESPGLYLTVRGKAIEGGTEGDVVNVMNLQSKRTVAGVVTGRGQVSITVAAPRPTQPASVRHLDAPAPIPSNAAVAVSNAAAQPIMLMSSRINRLVLTARCFRWRPLASGCSSIDRLSQIGEQPRLTEIENPTTQPGYKPVQMPMPKPEQASYNANSLWRNGSRAFFKDQRARRSAIILTVTVNITDKANIANETQRSRTNKEDSGINDFVGSKLLTGKAAMVMPGRILTADSTASK